MSLNTFSKNCKEESLKILTAHSGSTSIDILDCEPTDVSLHNGWSAFIFLGGSKFRFMFKVDFTTITLLSLAAERFEDVDEADYIDHVKDFMREYCNLFAGKLKASFEKVTDAYLSLPIIAREYDLQSLFGVAEDNIDEEKWSIGDNKMKVDITLYFYEKEEFDNFDFINEHLDDSNNNDEIDFF